MLLLIPTILHLLGHLFSPLLFSYELFSRLLLPKQCHFDRCLLEYTLLVIGELIHHLEGELLNHLSPIRISCLGIMVPQTLGHCTLSVINCVGECSLAFLVLDLCDLLILPH